MVGAEKGFFLSKGIRCLIAGLIAIFLMLGGCAPKQDSSSSADFAVVTPDSSSPGQLSSIEKKAFHTKGQIDKNLTETAMQDVAQQYKYFLRKGRNGMCSVSKRSEQYLAYARQVFREKGMPEELANLAIIESGYRPDAVSKAGAAGAWQFMPGTGVKYGLIQDSWQDERLDPYKATEAAAEYLQTLYSYFGDWPTAIAAYNAGEGKMSRALAGTGGKDFFEAKERNHLLDEKTQLREETKQYVPKFLAVTKIMRNLPDLGFEPINPENAQTVKRFTVQPGTDLTAMSKACALPWSEFSLYNQHHKRNITCTTRQTNVYVPSRVKELATAYLTSGNNGAFSGWKLTKALNSKDSLENISKRGKVDLELLKAANPGISKIKSGQVLLVPPQIELGKMAVAQTEKSVINNKNISKDSFNKKQNASHHVIKEKETLYSIAKKYNIPTNELMAFNNIINPGTIKIGQTLKVPGSISGKNKAEKAQKSKKNSYTVMPKDNFWSISRKLNISVADLKKWNKIDEKSLKPGATLIVAED